MWLERLQTKVVANRASPSSFRDPDRGLTRLGAAEQKFVSSFARQARYAGVLVRISAL